VEGKTVTETFSTDAALRKAQREVEEYHRFRRLSQELLEVNEQICRLRPILAEASAEEKKNAEAIQEEISRELSSLLGVIFAGLRQSGRFDLEAIEMRIRAAAHHMGAKVLQELLQAPESFERERPCGCGQKARCR
jgi:hypothetical protein